MKGFVVEIGLIGIIFTVGSMLFVLLPLIFMKVHLVEVLDMKYKYDNAQLALLSVTNMEHKDKFDGKVKPASEIIAEYISMPSSRSSIDISFVKSSLDNMVTHGIMDCYRLSSSSAVEIAVNNAKCDPKDNTAQMVIPMPYNGQTFSDEITLVMN